MLEDEDERIARFSDCLKCLPVSMPLLHERTAQKFISLYLEAIEASTELELICLDHDLFVVNEGDPDPGDGRDVARFLAEHKPTCPILIHSTNSAAADSMLYTLLDAGWKADRIAPLGADWIESYWFPYMRTFLGLDKPKESDG